MDANILEKLYKDESLLYYLRTHPKWYKKLSSDSHSFSSFLKEANVNNGNTITNKIEKLNNQVNFINGIYQYMKNG